MTQTWQENLSAELDRFEERVTGIPQDDDDDDTPTMPTLDAALALLESINPDAAAAARAYLDGNENKSTVLRVRLTVAEKVQIHKTAKALGYESVSEFIRARALA